MARVSGARPETLAWRPGSVSCYPVVNGDVPYCDLPASPREPVGRG
jgi:hypothetical protein